jgi:hypothetical protein
MGSDRSWLVDIDENRISAGYSSNHTLAQSTSFLDCKKEQLLLLGESTKSNDSSCWDGIKYPGGAEAASVKLIEVELVRLVSSITYADWNLEQKSFAQIYDSTTDSWEALEGTEFISFLPSRSEDADNVYLHGGFKHMEYMPSNSLTKIAK